jgi:hypothetical protein
MILLGVFCAITAGAPLTLKLAPQTGPPFPPGRRFEPSKFWAGSPILPLTKGPQRPAADLIASGEAAMLGWLPGVGAENSNVTPMSDSHSLVRLLGGGASAAGPDGDVVLRDESSGTLTMMWPLLWSRLDPWVNASGIVHPILVLDNVPYAFCDPTKCNANGSKTPGAKYGMDYGPANVTEYKQWIKELLRGMLSRYGEERCSSFWFRVGTEPNTRPGHWNDTNTKYVDEYVAVAAAVGAILPNAKVGLANMGADGSHWDDYVMPIARAIAKSGAQVDFVAMSCYGRGTGGRYAISAAALCAERLSVMKAVGGTRWARLPSQMMEYGLQQNELNLVDDDPGVFGGAWMLATSVAHAQAGVERGFHWHYGELSFAHDEKECSSAVSASPCSLYKGTAWVQAQAAHLFDNGTTATVLEAVSPGSNATASHAETDSRPAADVTSVDGIGGWDGDELRLLVTAFNPRHKTSDGEMESVTVAFEQPLSWAEAEATTTTSSTSNSSSNSRLQLRVATLNRSTSTFDQIWVDGKANGWLTDASDPNVYPLSLSATNMLTREGKKALEQESGASLLAMQRKTFAPSPWRDAGANIVCHKGNCTLFMEMKPPSVVAIWGRVAAAGSR